jgi:hypothetical protein
MMGRMRLPGIDPDAVPFGIVPDEHVRVGDHIAYFWETDQEFDRGVDFLTPGLAGQDHCVIFGHDEANARVIHLLKREGIDVEGHERNGRLTIAGSESTGDATLARLATVFQSAVEGGAPLIRLLGNIGWARLGWPDEDDLLLFESKVTGAARAFSAVVVCMYDVRTLSGRAIVNGGLGTHPITVCGNMMRVNPYYTPPDQLAERVLHTARRQKA